MRSFAALWLVACAAPAAPAPTGIPYLDDVAFRRDELVRGLVNPGNGYSRVRLAHYAVPGGWDDLPTFNPSTTPLTETASPPPSFRDLDIDPTDDAALLALGEDAFFHYPTQILPALDAITDPARYGLWRDPERGVGGVQRVFGARETRAATCSTCHATLRDGTLVPGLANEQLDLGALLVDAGAVPPAVAAAFHAWGPGRLDVTTATGVEPVRIPDLRATAWQSHLQADATVAQRDLTTLAIRLETLVIVTHGETERPPRIVALALARYLWSLADKLPALPPTTARGAAVFASHCAQCHAPPALSGPPVALAIVGTDPRLGQSLERGTGSYAVPSLHGVGARGRLLHDASFTSLDAMFDPARTAGGHLFGLDLAADERADLLAYLEML